MPKTIRRIFIKTISFFLFVFLIDLLITKGDFWYANRKVIFEKKDKFVESLKYYNEFYSKLQLVKNSESNHDQLANLKAIDQILFINNAILIDPLKMI